ncbi:MAG: hypothetical protein EP329_23175 [Deltaproteobacteria bacterium]|nr:MAG: hypothetical protein EP329_23175 [Deltaproteobacteria bacterium]
MRRLSTFMTVVMAAGLMGCPPSTVPDTDDNPASADLPRLPPDLEVQDALDPSKGDKVDFKQVTAFDDGKGKITLIVGNPFGGPHSLVGEAGVYTTSAELVSNKVAIAPDEHNYTLEFEVSANENYLLKLMATKGKAPYKLSFSVEVPPKDPCEDVECDEESECVDGKCVQIEASDECNPKCPRSKTCVDGKCEPWCGGGCDKGEYCSHSKNKCFKDPCYGKKCGDNQKCKFGKCIDVAPAPKGCNPPCADGEVCQGTSCVKKSAPEAPADGPISGRIIQLIPQGDKTFIVLDKGSKQGVKVGATGSIAGVAGQFKVTEVYTFRSKAVIKVDDKAIGGNRNVTISR